MFADVLVPGPPKRATFTIHQHQWHDTALAGLHQRERLITFIHSAEAAREKDNRIGMAQEGEFAGEEVFECDELFIVLDDGVRALFPRQANIRAKASFQTGAFMTGLHDARAGSSNDHPSF